MVAAENVIKFTADGQALIPKDPFPTGDSAFTIGWGPPGY